MAKPISPDEVSQIIPDIVIECFNQLIQKTYIDGHKSSSFKQDEVIDLIMANSQFSRDEIFEKCYLDVEPLYKKAGWKAEYHKPDRDESFKAYFKFSKIKNNQGTF